MFNISQQGSFHMKQNRHKPQRISARNLRHVRETPFLIKHVRLPSPWFPASNSKQETQSICCAVCCLRISSMIQQGLCNLPDFSQCPVWSRYSKWHTRFTRDSHDVNLQIRKYFNPLISIYRSLYPCLAKATSTGTEQRCVAIN